MDINKFLEIENKYNLYNANIDGAYFWMYKRFNLWNYDICKQSLDMANPHDKKKRSMTQYVLLVLRIVRESIKHPLYKVKNKDILFISHPRRGKVGEKFECLYTDKLSAHYGDKSVTIEEPFELEHMLPVATKNIIFTDYIKLLTGIKVRLYKKFKHKEYNKLKKKIETIITPAIDELEIIYSWKADRKALVEKYSIAVLEHNFADKAYKNMMTTINPKIMVVVVSYSQLNMQLIEIAKKLGIKTVELQHGTLYPGHAAYNFAKGVSIKQFPDCIFLFSDFWKSSMRPPIDEDKIISTGYTQFDEKLKLYGSKRDKSNGRNILFISQGTIGIQLSELASELSKILSDEYTIIYKLHPSEYSTWKEKYNDLEKSRVEVIHDNKQSIYSYFDKSDIIVGVYSTAIYEGLGFGLNAYIYRVGHYENMQTLVDEGYAKYVDNAEELIEYIRNSERQPIEKEFWKPNAYENIIEAIDGIMSN